MHLAQNIKYLREQKGITQNEMANVFGISQSATGNWETGERKPNIEMIVRLADYFGVTLDDLVLKDLKPPIPLYVSNIRYLRKKHEMTQGDIARFLDVSKANYCKYENGSVDVGIEKLLKLSDFFGVTLDELIKQNLEGGA